MRVVFIEFFFGGGILNFLDFFWIFWIFLNFFGIFWIFLNFWGFFRVWSGPGPGLVQSGPGLVRVWSGPVRVWSGFGPGLVRVGPGWSGFGPVRWRVSGFGRLGQIYIRFVRVWSGPVRVWSGPVRHCIRSGLVRSKGPSRSGFLRSHSKSMAQTRVKPVFFHGPGRSGFFSGPGWGRVLSGLVRSGSWTGRVFA